MMGEWSKIALRFVIRQVEANAFTLCTWSKLHEADPRRHVEHVSRTDYFPLSQKQLPAGSRGCMVTSSTFPVRLLSRRRNGRFTINSLSICRAVSYLNQRLHSQIAGLVGWQSCHGAQINRFIGRQKYTWLTLAVGYAGPTSSTTVAPPQPAKYTFVLLHIFDYPRGKGLLLRRLGSANHSSERRDADWTLKCRLQEY
jgi:hypothetical protein